MHPKATPEGVAELADHLLEAIKDADKPTAELIEVLNKLGNEDAVKALAVLVTTLMIGMSKLVPDVTLLKMAHVQKSKREREVPSAGNATRYGTGNGGYL